METWDPKPGPRERRPVSARISPRPFPASTSPRADAEDGGPHEAHGPFIRSVNSKIADHGRRREADQLGRPRRAERPLPRSRRGRPAVCRARVGVAPRARSPIMSSFYSMDRRARDRPGHFRFPRLALTRRCTSRRSRLPDNLDRLETISDVDHKGTGRSSRPC